ERRGSISGRSAERRRGNCLAQGHEEKISQASRRIVTLYANVKAQLPAATDEPARTRTHLSVGRCATARHASYVAPRSALAAHAAAIRARSHQPVAAR